MAFNEFQLKEIEVAIEKFIAVRRPPEEIRDKLDVKVSVEGQNLFIYQVRPDWRDPNLIREIPVAKATYVKSSNGWKVYWMGRTMKWAPYEPKPKVKTIQDFFNLVAEDQYCAFWG